MNFKNATFLSLSVLSLAATLSTASAMFHRGVDAQAEPARHTAAPAVAAEEVVSRVSGTSLKNWMKDTNTWTGTTSPGRTLLRQLIKSMGSQHVDQTLRENVTPENYAARYTTVYDIFRMLPSETRNPIAEDFVREIEVLNASHNLGVDTSLAKVTETRPIPAASSSSNAARGMFQFRPAAVTPVWQPRTASEIGTIIDGGNFTSLQNLLMGMAPAAYIPQQWEGLTGYAYHQKVRGVTTSESGIQNSLADMMRDMGISAQDIQMPSSSGQSNEQDFYAFVSSPESITPNLQIGASARSGGVLMVSYVDIDSITFSENGRLLPKLELMLINPNHTRGFSLSSQTHVATRNGHTVRDERTADLKLNQSRFPTVPTPAHMIPSHAFTPALTSGTATTSTSVSARS